MSPFTCLPPSCRSALEGLRSEFKWNHFLTFSWLLVLQLLNYGPGDLMSLSRMTNALSYHQMTRFLKANYDPNRWLLWLAQRLFEHLPPPKDGVFKIKVDCTRKPKRSKRNPGMVKGKDSSNGPWVLGLHILVVSAHWHTYRIPLLFALIRNKKDTRYQAPNQVLIELLQKVPVPTWAKKVIVLADAGFASKANFRLFEKWNWGYVVRLPRSWKLSDGRKLTEVIETTKEFQRVWIPSINGKRRNTYHFHYLPTKLCHLGDVYLVIAKKRRNHGPKAVRVLVTNLPLAPKAVLALYQCRWYVEVLFKEIKGTMALGQSQVNTSFEQVERSIGLSLAAYLLLLRLKADQIPEKGSWSAFELKRQFWQQTMSQIFSHSANREVRKRAQLMLSAQPA